MTKFELGHRPRVIKPATTRYIHMPIVAYVGGDTALTETGELVNAADHARSGPPSIWVTSCPEELWWTLERQYGKNLCYHMAQTGRRLPGGPARNKTYLDGFRWGNAKSGRKYHCVWWPEGMDPTLRRSIGSSASFGDLLTFALDLRDWLSEHNLPIKPRLPQIAGRLFRDGKFWPEGKSAVPGATNNFVRSYLVGGFVHTFTHVPSPVFPLVDCYDQNGGYHTAASQIHMPDAESLFARGNFQDTNSTRKWGSVEKLENHVGLLKVKLANGPDGRVRHYPTALNTAFAPDRYEHLQGICYIWTNELDLVYASGAEIEYVIAAWTSTTYDSGYAEYARFALAELAKSDDIRKRWLKPTLHMVHGLGAAKPGIRTHAYSHSAKGIEVNYWLKGLAVPVKEIRSKRAVPVPTSNVLALGMLHAEVRARTFELANAFERFGYDVLHMHSDSVHVDGSRPALPAPPDWKHEQYTNVVYENNVWFRSDQKLCHPGERFSCQ